MPSIFRRLFAIAVFGATMSGPRLCAGPIVGQIDTFTGSAQNWTNGAPAADPVVVSAGGPAGAGDGFLQITADGAGAAGRLVAFNRAQWSGDFLSAGVNAVDMDLKNFGPTTLSIRVALKTGTAQTSPGFVSATPFLLPVDNLWHHALFLLDAANLTAVGAAPPLNTALSSVAEFRIINSSTANLNGNPIASQLGVDNIRADAVPEPVTLLCFLSGLAVMVWFKRLAPSIDSTLKSSSILERLDANCSCISRRNILCSSAECSGCQWNSARDGNG